MAAATTATTEAAPAVKTVKYTGDSGVREISAADWKRAGVEGQKTIVWDEANDYTVLASEFSPEALEILKRDRQLKISS